MKPGEILTKAIEKAIAGGWTIGDWTDADEFKWEIEPGDFEGDTPCLKYGGMGEIFYMGIGAIMLDHDFAKALWGESFDSVNLGKNGQTITLTYEYPNWQRHLMDMVISDDPIKYLGANL